MVFLASAHVPGQYIAAYVQFAVYLMQVSANVGENHNYA